MFLAAFLTFSPGKFFENEKTVSSLSNPDINDYHIFGRIIFFMIGICLLACVIYKRVSIPSIIFGSICSIIICSLGVFDSG